MRQTQRVFSLFLLSPSSRRAWIEIYRYCHTMACRGVALLAEGVDRNKDGFAWCRTAGVVALLAEGVDRNIMSVNGGFLSGSVALLAEGVDRND